MPPYSDGPPKEASGGEVHASAKYPAHCLGSSSFISPSGKWQTLILGLLLLGILPVMSFAQGRWIVTGAKVRIQSGTQVVVQGNFVLQDTGATQDFGHLFVWGDFLNTSTATLPFSGTGGKVTLNGTAAQNIGGTRVTRFEDLIVNNGAGVTQLIDAEINDTLFFTNGLVNTGAFMMRLLATGEYSNAATGRFVNGWMGRTYTLGSNVTRAFGIGDNLGFTPATILYPSITTQGVLALRTTNPDHPNLNTSTINPLLSVNRYWQLRNHLLSPQPSNFQADLNFLAGDRDIGLNTAAISGEQFNGGVWNTLGVLARTPTSIQLNNITQLGDIAVGEAGMPSATISGSSTVCPGGSAVLTVTLGGNGPWNITWTDGTSNNTQLNITSSPYLISVTPTATTTYTLVSVTNPIVGIVSGTGVVTVRTQPTATISGVQTICLGQTATLTVSLGGSSPWNIVYANGVTPVTVTGITSSPFLITVTPAVNTNYSMVSVNNGCVGTTSGFVPVTVVPVPVALITGTQTICSGNAAQFSIALTGVTPWTVSWTDGTTNTTQTGVTANPFLVSVTPATSRTYSLTQVFSGCTGTISGQAAITVVPVPTASIAGNHTICPGNASILTVNLTGAAPWDINWTDGTTTTPVNGITSSPYLLSVTPAVSSTYSLTSVFSVCSGSVSGAGTVFLRPIPQATLSGAQTICTGGTASLSVAFTGTAPYDIIWTDGVTSSTVTNILSSPYVFSVTPSTSSTYTLTSVTAVCTGTVLGQGTVQVNPIPTAAISGNYTICGSNGANLSVSLTGTAPWSVTWTDGTNNTTQVGITANPYVFSVTPSVQTSYSLQQVFATCAGTVSGMSVVSSSPIPTGTLSGAQTICAGAGANFSVNLTGIGPWNIDYSDGTSTFTQTGITSSPYTLSVSPAIHTTYTLTQVNGLCSGLGSGSATVRVNPVPQASLAGAHTICVGSSASLSVTLTGAAPFSLTWTNGTTPVTVNNILTSPYVFSVTPSVSTTYSLTQVNATCAGTVSGSGTVLVVPVPNAVLTGTQTICTGTGVNLSVNLTGHAPWAFTYTDGTNAPVSITGVTTSPYLIAITPAGNSNYTLSSVQAVCSGAVSGNAQITVRPVPTANISGAQTICTGSSTTLTVLLTGVGPWNLNWTDGVNPFSQTGINSNPYIITVAPTVSSTYTLTQVFATCTGTISGAGTVQVNLPPTATISGSQTICTGGSAQLTVSFTGASPWNFTYNAGVTPVTVTGITANPYVFSVSPAVSTTYSAAAVFSNCAGLVSGNAQVTVTPIPAASLSGSQTICTGSSGILTVSFSGLAPWNLTYSDGTNLISIPGITNSPYGLSLNPLVNTTYTLTQVSGVCPGTVSGSGRIVVNPVPTASISGGATICPNNPVSLTIAMTGTGPWNITWTDGVSSFNQNGLLNSPFVINLSPTVSRTYSVSSVFATCNGSVSGTAPVQVTNPPVGFMNGNTTICQGGSASLNVGLTGFAPWTITWTDGVTPTTVTGITASPYLISVTPAATRVYNLVSVSANCPGTAAGSGVVVVNPIPTASFATSFLPVCTGQSRQVQVNLTGIQPWSISYTDGVTPVTVNGITTNPYFFTVNPVATENYTLTNVNATCNGTFGTSAITVQPEAAPTATLSGTQTVCILTPATLSVNFTGTGPWDIVYTDGANNYSVNGITANPATFQVPMGATPKTINLVSVTGACAGTVSGTAAIAITNKPVAVLSAPSGMCLGLGGQLSVSISGLGPWDLTYTDGTNIFTENAIASSPYSWTVNPASSATYQLLNVVGPHCTGSVLSTAISVPVSIQPSATLSGTQTLCSGNTATLTLSMTGQAPWTAVYSNGSNSFVLSGLTADTVITVSPLATTTYTLTTIATNGCTGISNGSEEVFVVPNVTASVAGASQTICSNAFILGGNIPAVGTGQWKIIQGTGVLSDSSLYNSAVNNLNVGMNILEWEISTPACISTSQLTLHVTVPPTTANAGTDQYLCGTSTVLNGNAPVNGTGTWTILSGMGTLLDPNDANSPVNNLLIGQTVLQWTIVSGACTSSSTINIYAALSAPATSAGQDQLICSGVTSLNAMTPTVGTGYWVRASGSGIIQDTLDAQSAVSGLSLGLNSFVWITQNAGCFATDTVEVQVVQAPDANFIYTQFGFDVDFADVSTGGAGTYSWTFGDGGISSNQNPHHTYMQAGVYPVRLIITNICRSDTVYDTIRIGGVKNAELSDSSIGIELYPNPASTGYVDLKVKGIYGEMIRVKVFNILGAEILVREIATEGRESFTQRIELGTLLAKGPYTVVIETERGVKSEKLVVL